MSQFSSTWMNANPLSMPNSDPLWNGGNSEENQQPLNQVFSIYDNIKQPNRADPYNLATAKDTVEDKRSAVDSLSHLASRIDQLATSDPNSDWPSVSRSTIASPLVTGSAVPSLPLHSQQFPFLQSHQIQWVYLDPSGNEQGPFDGNMMQSWFSAGYLQANLRLKNSVDPQFKTLGEFMADCGEFEHPFLVPLTLMKNPLSAVNQRPQSPWISHQNSVVDLGARNTIDLTEKNSPFISNASLNAFTPEPEVVHTEKTVEEPVEEPLENSLQEAVVDREPFEPLPLEDEIQELQPVERFTPTEEEPKEPSKPKLAPWASKSSAKPKLSLKEIQDMEAAENAKRREQEQSESKEAAKIAAVKLLEEEKQEIEANKPKHFSKTAPWAATKSAPMKPSKTLEDIQREEAAAAARVANASAKTSFATAAAASPASHDTAWTVVSKKSIPRVKPKPTAAAPLISASKTISPAMLRSASTNSAVQHTTPPSTSSSSPSREFLAWCRQSLSQLNDGVNKEDVLSIMLQLPVGSESQEIIADTIYSNSSTMDGRRFASEFMNRRAKVESLVSGAGIHFSWSEAQAKSGNASNAEYDDWNSAFKVVTKKGKRRN